MIYRLPPLPYPFTAFEPYLSETTVRRHYEDNHAGYYRRLNELVRGTEWDGLPVEQIALATIPYMPINNNAAQAWAHDFWWRSMTPRTQPFPKWLDRKRFERDWIEKGTALFGSGWVWLSVTPDRQLSIDALPDAELPQRRGLRPILVMDLWEHAYYCQYGTKRADYLRNMLPFLDWQRAHERLT
jgi:Fe-Mn family superoxide dismutase